MIDSVIARGKLKQLIAALDAERQILLHGPLAELAKTSARRDQLLESLVNGGPVSQRILSQWLDKIKTMAARNAALLAAAMDGMKDARKDIEIMAENLNQLETYSRDGGKMLVAQTMPGKGHRI